MNDNQRIACAIASELDHNRNNVTYGEHLESKIIVAGSGASPCLADAQSAKDSK